MTVTAIDDKTDTQTVTDVTAEAFNTTLELLQDADLKTVARHLARRRRATGQYPAVQWRDVVLHAATGRDVASYERAGKRAPEALTNVVRELGAGNYDVAWTRSELWRAVRNEIASEAKRTQRARLLQLQAQRDARQRNEPEPAANALLEALDAARIAAGDDATISAAAQALDTDGARRRDAVEDFASEARATHNPDIVRVAERLREASAQWSSLDEERERMRRQGFCAHLRSMAQDARASHDEHPPLTNSELDALCLRVAATFQPTHTVRRAPDRMLIWESPQGEQYTLAWAVTKEKERARFVDFTTTELATAARAAGAIRGMDPATALSEQRERIRQTLVQANGNETLAGTERFERGAGRALRLSLDGSAPQAKEWNARVAEALGGLEATNTTQRARENALRRAIEDQDYPATPSTAQRTQREGLATALAATHEESRELPPDVPGREEQEQQRKDATAEIQRHDPGTLVVTASSEPQRWEDQTAKRYEDALWILHGTHNALLDTLEAIDRSCARATDAHREQRHYHGAILELEDAAAGGWKYHEEQRASVLGIEEPMPSLSDLMRRHASATARIAGHGPVEAEAVRANAQIDDARLRDLGAPKGAETGWNALVATMRRCATIGSSRHLETQCQRYRERHDRCAAALQHEALVAGYAALAELPDKADTARVASRLESLGGDALTGARSLIGQVSARAERTERDAVTRAQATAHAYAAWTEHWAKNGRDIASRLAALKRADTELIEVEAGPQESQAQGARGDSP